MIYWARKYFSDRPAHLLALYEVACTAVFSIIPFAIAFGTESARRSDGQFAALSDIVGHGQVFLLIYTIYGTIIWLAFGSGETPRHGARIFLGICATLSILPVVGLLGADPTFEHVLNPTLIKISYWGYGLFLFLNYLLLFYSKIDPPDPKEVYSREARNMAGKFKEMTEHD